MAHRALIVWGGYGHSPEEVASILAHELRQESFEVEVSDTLDAFRDLDKLRQLDLIVPIWTMGEIHHEQLRGLVDAVVGGVGIGCCHGAADAFRDEPEYQFMIGGQFVGHPGDEGTDYRVRIVDQSHFVTAGAVDFDVTSEQYYLHVDPSNHVLASTGLPVADGPHVPNGKFDMPVAWTRYHGRGRVYYCSLGHTPEIVSAPHSLRLITRGLVWAARADGSAPPTP